MHKKRTALDNTSLKFNNLFVDVLQIAFVWGIFLREVLRKEEVEEYEQKGNHYFECDRRT